MTDGYAPHLIGRAQDLGDGRFGVVVERGDTTYYVEHAVTEDGLHAQVWDEEHVDLVVERTKDWDEVVTRMFSTWQRGPESDQ